MGRGAGPGVPLRFTPGWDGVGRWPGRCALVLKRSGGHYSPRRRARSRPRREGFARKGGIGFAGRGLRNAVCRGRERRERGRGREDRVLAKPVLFGGQNPGCRCALPQAGMGWAVGSSRGFEKVIPSPPSKPSREPVLGRFGGGAREGWERGEGDADGGRGAEPMACPLILIFLPPIFLPLPTEWGQKKG